MDKDVWMDVMILWVMESYNITGLYKVSFWIKNILVSIEFLSMCSSAFLF